MHAIILAGGKGTRLQPYTVSFPKPLVPVGDHPILEIIIRQLVHAGFDRVTISTGHLAELIVAYFGDGSKFGVAIDYVREDKPLSTAGALKLVPDIDDCALVMNGDVLTDLDYREFLDAHHASGARASVAVKRRCELVDFGVVERDEGGYLTGWREKPSYEFEVSMGVYAVARPALDLIAEGEALGMPELFLRILDRGERVFCHPTDAYWLDIGRVDDYALAQAEFEANRAALFPGDD